MCIRDRCGCGRAAWASLHVAATQQPLSAQGVARTAPAWCVAGGTACDHPDERPSGAARHLQASLSVQEPGRNCSSTAATPGPATCAIRAGVMRRACPLSMSHPRGRSGLSLCRTGVSSVRSGCRVAFCLRAEAV
eukprot:2091189-Prymnesium_polylepis.1